MTDMATMLPHPPWCGGGSLSKDLNCTLPCCLANSTGTSTQPILLYHWILFLLFGSLWMLKWWTGRGPCRGTPKGSCKGAPLGSCKGAQLGPREGTQQGNQLQTSSSDEAPQLVAVGWDVLSDSDEDEPSGEEDSSVGSPPPPPPPPPLEPPPEPPPGMPPEPPMEEEEPTPPDPESPVSVNIATFNITSGRNSRLPQALRALEMLQVDLCFLTEAKLTDGIYTRFSSGYHVTATSAESHRQGGIALAYRDSDYWQVESIQRHGPNVMSCILVTGNRCHPLVGAYIPPADVSTIEFVERALNRFSQGPAPILLGDLNVNLREPTGARETQIAAMVASYSLQDMIPHFKQRPRYRDGATWRQYRNGELVKGWCDYLLGTDRSRLRKVCIRDPRCFSSDHFVVMGKLMSERLRSNRRYLNGRQRFPLKAHKVGPTSSLADQLFQKLKDAMPNPTGQERRRAAWISEATWRLVDARSSLRRSEAYTQAEHRRLNRKVKASLKEDRKHRVEDAGDAIESALRNQDAQGAWDRLKAWYRQAEDRAPKPTRRELATVTTEYANLYSQTPPPGDPVPITVAPFNILDDVPDDAEIEVAVRRLRRGKAPGPTGLRADHLKEWLDAARREHEPDSANWDSLVALVQHCFESGELPTELARSTMVLLPKASGGFRGIGLLEIVWKVIASVMNRRFSDQIIFHDALHGFRASRGTGTATIEAKLLQQWAKLTQIPLYEIFLDLRKAYDTLDRDRTLVILEGYGVGPRSLKLLRQFWVQQKVVAKQSGYFGEAFDATRGVTQGDIISPTIFNIVADNVIRCWLGFVSDEVTDSAEGLGHNVTQRAAFFYADDGLVASPDKQWLQQAFEVLSDLFARMGLKTNTEKTKVMICTPGYIRTYYSTHAYKRKVEDQGDTYRERKRRRTTCASCAKDLALGSLLSHMRTQHGEELPPPMLVAAPPPREFTVGPWPKGQAFLQPCPFEECPFRAQTQNLLRRHFATQHPGSTFRVRGEILHPPCVQCGMQVTPNALKRGHLQSQLCRMIQREREQARLLTAAHEAQATVFSALGVELEKVTNFCYLGRPLSEVDSDWPALRRNLTKARQRWAMISRIIVREGATPRVSGYFYKAVVQSVLLYGSETWVWSQSMRLALQGFHHRVARKITDLRPRLQNGIWVVPPIGQALEGAGLCPIEEYITRRRDTLLAQVTPRPLYQICQATQRMPGTPTQTQFWWEQFTVDNPFIRDST